MVLPKLLSVDHDYWGMPGFSEEAIKEVVKPGFYFKMNFFSFEFFGEHIFNDGFDYITVWAMAFYGVTEFSSAPLVFSYRYAHFFLFIFKCYNLFFDVA